MVSWVVGLDTTAGLVVGFSIVSEDSFMEKVGVIVGLVLVLLNIVEVDVGVVPVSTTGKIVSFGKGGSFAVGIAGTASIFGDEIVIEEVVVGVGE